MSVQRIDAPRSGTCGWQARAYLWHNRYLSRFFADGLNIQVPAMDDKDDYERLLRGLQDLGLEPAPPSDGSISASQLADLARELLVELAGFVESDGDSSYCSTEEKEAELHIQRARALIARARATLDGRGFQGPTQLSGGPGDGGTMTNDATPGATGSNARAERLDAIPTECPKCGCTHWSQRGTRTADSHRAWKDTDGTWYNGPAEERTRRECAHCGWSQQIVRKRGKLESVESDAF